MHNIPLAKDKLIKNVEKKLYKKKLPFPWKCNIVFPLDIHKYFIFPFSLVCGLGRNAMSINYLFSTLFVLNIACLCCFFYKNIVTATLIYRDLDLMIDKL